MYIHRLPDETVVGEGQQERRGKSLFRLSTCLLVIGMLWGCTDGKAPSRLERIRQKGELTVATRIGPATYHPGPNGPIGIEHDLAQAFAQRLGVKVNFLVAGSVAEIIQALADGRADVAAAGLAITNERKQQLRFAPAYRTVTEYLVYRGSATKPESLAALTDGILEVAGGSPHIGTLENLRRDAYPGLSWRVSQEHDVSELLYLLDAGLIDYTVVTSDQFRLLRRYFPNVRSAFDLGTQRTLAWGVVKSQDSSLYDETVAFFNDIKRDHTLDRLLARYYDEIHDGPEPQMDDDLAFRRHLRQRLPLYRRWFEQAAAKYGLDWRLLAAIAYQESRWDPNAVSPTGVRGLMMLTEDTARQFNVKNRVDPEDSIMGGASVVSHNLMDMPSEVADPDRTWLALVAYNAGPAVLRQARSLASRHGLRPDYWRELKPVLAARLESRPLAKGVPAPARQSVMFVESVRRYYERLVFLTEQEEGRNALLKIAA